MKITDKREHQALVRTTGSVHYGSVVQHRGKLKLLAWNPDGDCQRVCLVNLENGETEICSLLEPLDAVLKDSELVVRG